MRQRRKQETIKLRAGALDSRLLTVAQIEFLAALPSREVLLAQVAGTLNAPIAAYVRLLNQLIVRLLYVLKEIENEKTINFLTFGECDGI